MCIWLVTIPRNLVFRYSNRGANQWERQKQLRGCYNLGKSDMLIVGNTLGPMLNSPTRLTSRKIASSNQLSSWLNNGASVAEACLPILASGLLLKRPILSKTS